jgi:Zn-dependent protease
MNIDVVDSLLFMGTLLLLFLSLSIHESAHALAAYRLGDDTAVRAGRLSLNPMVHIDPVMTILFPVVLMVTTGVAFGAAKPVPVNTWALRHPRRDMMWIAWVGPASNFLIVILLTLCINVVVYLCPPGDVQNFLGRLLIKGIVLNLALGGFNLLPVPPLDGSRILAALVPEAWSERLYRMEPYGILIVGLLVWLGVTDVFGEPVLYAGRWMLHWLTW